MIYRCFSIKYIARFWVVVTALLLAAQSVRAELFWHYQKNQQQGFLLGSVHFANSDFYPLDARVMAAYERSSVLVVEVDEQTVPESQRQALLKQYGFYPKNETLQDHLKPETLQIVETLLDEFGIPMQQVRNYRPGLLAIILTAHQAEKLGYHADQGIDLYFLQKARYRKTIRQIEDYAFQMKLLAELPDQDDILIDNFREMADYKKTWAVMMSAWKQGDGSALYEEAIAGPLREYPKLKPFFDVLFFNRHTAMVGSVEQCVANKEICFIVVGAGHFPGEKGIVSELIRKGFSVTQMK